MADGLARDLRGGLPTGAAIRLLHKPALSRAVQSVRNHEVLRKAASSERRVSDSGAGDRSVSGEGRWRARLVSEPATKSRCRGAGIIRPSFVPKQTQQETRT